MTAICGMALGKKPIPKNTDVHFATANFLLPGGQEQKEQRKMTSQTSQVDGSTGELLLAWVEFCLSFDRLIIFSFVLPFFIPV